MNRPVSVLVLSLLGLAVLALILTSTFSPLAITDRDDSTNGEGAAPSVSYLYVLNAGAGSLVAGDEPGTYELRLEKVDDDATFFTDRPARDAGTTPVPDMLGLLYEGNQPVPNAALVGVVPDGERQTVPLELHAPAYGAEDGTLAFTVELLDEPTPAIAHHKFDPLGEPPIDWEEIELFIDSAYHNCHVAIRNNLSDAPLELHSMDPTSSGRWGTGDPPKTVPPNSSATVDFKFKADVTAKEAVLVYYHTPPPQPGITYSTLVVTLSWKCSYHSIGENTERGASCELSGRTSGGSPADVVGVDCDTVGSTDTETYFNLNAF